MKPTPPQFGQKWLTSTSSREVLGVGPEGVCYRESDAAGFYAGTEGKWGTKTVSLAFWNEWANHARLVREAGWKPPRGSKRSGYNAGPMDKPGAGVDNPRDD